MTPGPLGQTPAMRRTGTTASERALRRRGGARRARSRRVGGRDRRGRAGAVLVAVATATVGLGLGLGLVGSDPAGAAAPPPASGGYWFVGGDGGVFAFGGAGFHGSTGATRLNRPIVGMATTRTGDGYWLAASDGGVFAFGDAAFHGSMGAVALNRPVVAIVATPSGRGYWLVASDGGVFSFGDAAFRGSTGSIKLNQPVVAAASTPTGRGYWLVAADGGVFSFGDAVFRGSTGSIRLNRPVVGMAPSPSGRGYWMVASDGGVFAFGDAPFRGSMGATPLNRPIVGMAATPRSLGYWMTASDGGVFAFGDATFAGSTGGQRLASPVVGMVASPARVTPEVAAFYYPWWATPERDGGWRHWEGNGHDPPVDVAANFYPQRGAYSSSDSAVLQAHMTEMAGAGIDLAVTSWWGRGSFEDDRLAGVLGAATNAGIRVAVHLEPYVGRSLATIAADAAYLRGLGVRDVWVYNAQGFAASSWAPVRAGMGEDMRVMAQSGNPAQMKSGEFSAFARTAGFDGIYTYDAVRFTPAEFAAVCATARHHGLLCSPSVSPGYVASRLKPGDSQFVARDGGARYDATWAGAIDGRADIVSITSYNEWHEGTQIEPAVPYCFPDGFCSPGYDGAYGTTGPPAPGAYLGRTLLWSTAFRR